MTIKDTCNLKISLSEFKQILNKKEEKEKSPVDYLIKKSEYKLKVNSKTMDVNLSLDISVLNDDLLDIKLFNSNSIIKSINLGKSTKDANIGFDGQYYSFWSKKVGEYSINVNYSIPINNISELKNISLNLISDSNINLSLDSKDEYKISPRFSLDETLNKEEKLVSFYAKKGNIDITWGKLEKKVKKEKKIEILSPIIHDTINMAVEVTDTSIIYNTKIAYQVYQASINKIDIEVKDTQIITIDGSYIKNYDIYEKDNKHYATIYFDREVEGENYFNIYSEQEFSTEQSELTIANFSVINAEREEGNIIVSSKTITDVEILEIEDIRSVDINELPNELKKIDKSKEAFKFLKTPYIAKLKLIKHKEIPMMVSMVNNAVFNTVVLKKGVILNSVFLELKNNNKPFLEIKLPENTLPLSAFVKGKPTKPIKGETENMMISLPKFTSSEEYFWIEMVFLTKTNKMEKTGDLKIELPKIDIAISHLFWKLLLPNRFKYKNFRGNIEKVNYFKTEPPYPPNDIHASGADYYKNEFPMEEEECLSELDDCFDDDCFAGAVQAKEMIDEPYPEVMKSMQVEIASAPRRREAKKKMAKKPAPAPKVMSQSRIMSSKGEKGSLFTQKQFGKIPVKIQIPLVGDSNYFEKLFLENDSIELNFSYKKVKKDEVEGI